MRTDLPADPQTLVVFSWGAPERLEAQIARSGSVAQKLLWIDPLCHGRSLPDFKKTERIEGVLSDTGAEVELLQYSLRDLYSLAPASAALTSLMPGLETRGTVGVPALEAKKLTRRLSALKGSFGVVIDIPGAEHQVLELLAQAGLWERMARLSMRCGVEAFFEGAQDAKALCAKLDAQGFALDAVETEEDPDWPEYTFRIDPRALRIKALESALEARDKSLSSAKAAATRAMKEAAALREDHDAVIKEAETHKARIAQRDTALAQLRKDHDAVVKECDGLKAQAEQEHTALAQLRAEHDGLRQDYDVAKAQTAQRDTALAQLRVQSKKSNAQAQEKNHRMEHEVAQLRLDLRRAGQAQERIQAGYDALQLRLAAVEEERQTLRGLLQQLTPKLREAAKQMRDMGAVPPTGPMSKGIEDGAETAKPKSKKKQAT